MGLFDTVLIEEGLTLPDFPEDPSNICWQTKTIGRPGMRIFKITKNGALLRKETSKRKCTPQELDKKAQDKGYTSWEEWENDESTFGPLDTWKITTDKTWWVNHEMHGSFEFHAHSKRIDSIENEDKYWSFEARFIEGRLDKIILLENRFK